MRELCAELIEREIRAEAGNGFELVERAAGVAKTAAGNHGDDDARRGRDGRADQAGLIADAAGRMLVDLDAGDVSRGPGLRRRSSCTR